MCLAVPVRIESVIDDSEAIVDIGGLKKKISTALVEDVYPGDYVILHVGYALEKLDTDEAETTLRLLHELAQNSPETDIMERESTQKSQSE